MNSRVIAAIIAVLLGMGVSVARDGRIYLSGHGLDDAVMWDFKVSDGRQSGRWHKIAVPSSWEPQGFGDFTYGRWYTVKGATPSVETGHYRRKFKLPRLAPGERVRLTFDGVMTDAEVKVNGAMAGDRHQGGFYRFSRDITPLVRRGDNTLEVIVYKNSSNKSINAAERKADWWLFGGIYRPVWLEIVPEVNMRQVTLDARHDGTFSAIVETEGRADGYRVVADLAGSTVSATTADSVFTLSGHADGVRPWAPETPVLYTATFSLVAPGGDTVQVKRVTTGFRTIDFRKQDGLYLNGHKIRLKGVNRHSFSVDGGRATSPAMSRMDAELIKQMNMNAVRSHYPPDEHFLDVCDSVGLLYIDELAGWHDRYDDTIAPRLVREMVERDVNHPCVIIWSNGNEGGWNKKVDGLFAAYDPLQRRHVIHPWADFNDLDTHHYPAYLTGVGRFTNGYKVFMPTEFMHAMYDQGGGAGLRNFWDRWLTNPMFAGGFIWAFTDEAPRRPDRGGALDSDGSNAPDGLLGPRREREGSFYAVRAQWSPIRLRPLLITPSWDGTFKVANEWDNTRLGDCLMQYRLVKVTPPSAGGAEGSERLLAAGPVRLPDIAPGETGTARIDLPACMADADLLQLMAFGPDGRQVCEWSVPVRLAAAYYDRHHPAADSTARASVSQDGGLTVLAGGDLRVAFDPATGMIREVVSGDSVIPLTNGPRAVGGKMIYQPDKSSARVEADGTAVFCARYKGVADSIVWRLSPDGLLTMNALMLNRSGGGGGFDDAFMDSEVYNFGLTFDYPETEVRGMAWLGRGPYRVWKNRQEGANIGLWHKDYNNTVTGESYDALVYPEFKGYHGNIYWARLDDRSHPWTLHSSTDGLYLQVFTPEEPKGSAKKTMPDFPDGDLSLLLDIPAICSFKPIEQQGPDSQPGNIRIKSGDEGLHIDVTFDFR